MALYYHVSLQKLITLIKNRATQVSLESISNALHVLYLLILCKILVENVGFRYEPIAEILKNIRFCSIANVWIKNDFKKYFLNQLGFYYQSFTRWGNAPSPFYTIKVPFLLRVTYRKTIFYVPLGPVCSVSVT